MRREGVGGRSGIPHLTPTLSAPRDGEGERGAMSIATKICGLSSEAAVAAAVEGGAAYLGFVFYPPSPRAVSPARAAALCAALPSGVQTVGLFVDAEDQ